LTFFLKLLFLFQHLDEDVRNERRIILKEDPKSTSSVILVRDLVQKFKKRKEKSLVNRIYTAVDHLNFRVDKQSCFGLLGFFHFYFYLFLLFSIF
jgi:ABC-type glutathione transport system ATPase component